MEFVSNVYQVDDRRVVQCNIRDITDRKRLEEGSRRHAEELVEADRRKDEFLAMLGHELRNPLPRSATPCTWSAWRPGTQQECARPTTIIERQVEHLVRLVDDLLDVSRITRGKIQLRRGARSTWRPSSPVPSRARRPLDRRARGTRWQ